jgi:uncharacterized phage-associated protein
MADKKLKAVMHLLYAEMEDKPQSFSKVKLALLCYYAYAWSYALTERELKLFDCDILAVEIGPIPRDFDDCWIEIVRELVTETLVEDHGLQEDDLAMFPFRWVMHIADAVGLQTAHLEWQTKLIN